MLNLPAEVLQVLDPSTLKEPCVAVRSLFDLEGNIGETHVIADPHTLHLLSRPLAGSFAKASSPLARVERMALRTEGMYHILEFRLDGQERVVRCTTWDQPELEKLLALWQGRVSDGESRSVDSAETASPAPLEICIPVAPRVLLAASLEAMAEVDGEVGALERSAIRRVLGESPAAALGIEHLRKRGLGSVLSALAVGLNLGQKQCLLANLLAVALSDGWLRSTEQVLLVRFEEALGLADGEIQAIRDALLTLYKVAVIAENGSGPGEPGGLTPVEVFCACLLAVVQEDGRVADEELEALERLIPDPAQWTAAAEIGATRGKERLLTDTKTLNRSQQRCLLANLLAASMSDGWLRGVEQVEIERFRLAMSIRTEDYASIYRVLMAKDDLSVFPGA